MTFDTSRYHPDVASVLALDRSGERLMPLAISECSSIEARDRINEAGAGGLFSSSAHPEGALAGLYAYFSCFEEAHSVAQDLHTSEGSFWHAIVHRQEPDAGNSSYWFHRTGAHPIFASLFEAAKEIEAQNPGAASLGIGTAWDPFRFIDYCEAARRRPGSREEQLARLVQRAEWQLLFDYCARSTK